MRAFLYRCYTEVFEMECPGSRHRISVHVVELPDTRAVKIAVCLNEDGYPLLGEPAYYYEFTTTEDKKSLFRKHLTTITNLYRLLPQ